MNKFHVRTSSMMSIESDVSSFGVRNLQINVRGYEDEVNTEAWKDTEVTSNTGLKTIQPRAVR
jgi:hypothetical protein